MAGAVSLSVKEVDLQETLTLLSERLDLLAPNPQLQQPPWLPPDHPLVEASDCASKQ